MILEGKRVLVTGGTGSLGQKIVRRMLSGEVGRPAKIIIFSRDEAKQHYMRMSFSNHKAATEEIIYQNSKELLTFRIGDTRDYVSLLRAVRSADIVVHTAALKQVPTCEYFPFQAVQTNILGTQNLIRAICENETPVKTVVGISTDKACKPINAMGMTKALMERMLIEANVNQPQTRFVCVRYGNVIASRGSVVPLFRSQIASGGPVTVTVKEMTRFLLSLDHAVDTVFTAIREAQPGEIYVPKVPAARVVDVAHALMGKSKIPVVYTGIRPGEKLHEILVTEEESLRTTERGNYYAIGPMLPELNSVSIGKAAFEGEYSSSKVTLDQEGLAGLLAAYVSEQLEHALL